VEEPHADHAHPEHEAEHFGEALATRVFDLSKNKN
jgi:hypothetical protein